jgi:hypothetical protein
MFMQILQGRHGKAVAIKLQKQMIRYMLITVRVMKDFKSAEFTDMIKKLDKNCTVFYNGGHVGPDIRKTIGPVIHIWSWSHCRVEAGDILHFPLTSRYARGPRARISLV